MRALATHFLIEYYPELSISDIADFYAQDHSTILTQITNFKGWIDDKEFQTKYQIALQAITQYIQY